MTLTTQFTRFWGGATLLLYALLLQSCQPHSVSATKEAFGAQEWQHYFGEVGPAPDLPKDITQILDTRCPFWPGRKVRDTHLLVLIPAKVDGEPFTLSLLSELIKSPKGGVETQYRYYNGEVQSQVGNNAPAGSYWLLMTRKVLPESRDKTYTDQKAIVAGHASCTGLSYELPKALEAATAILMHHVRTGERLYGGNPHIWTRCQELIRHRSEDVPLLVGGFASSGLGVSRDSFVGSFLNFGVAGCRKFEAFFSASSEAFGVQEWQHYFGELGEPTPDLPEDITQILDIRCPFWPERKVRDTHLLVLIPAKVAGKPFTLNLLGELIKAPKGGGSKTKYRHYNSAVQSQVGNEASAGSYWVLLTHGVLPESRNKTYAAQKELVAGHARRTGLHYELPKTLEAATAILTHYVRNGERLYGNKSWTYTRCQELIHYSFGDYPSVVGGFESSGLFVFNDRYVNDDCSGVAGCRKFF
jgi:hypothetical protein